MHVHFNIIVPVFDFNHFVSAQHRVSMLKSIAQDISQGSQRFAIRRGFKFRCSLVPS